MACVIASGKDRRRRMRAWVLAALAGVVVLLTATLGAATNISTGLLPKGRGWTWMQNPAVMWSVVAVLAVLLIVLAVVQHRLGAADPGSGFGTMIGSVTGPVYTGRATIMTASLG